MTWPSDGSAAWPPPLGWRPDSPSCWVRRLPREQNLPAAERPGASLRAAGALRAAARELEELGRTLAADGLSDDAQIVEAGALMARDPALEAAVERAVLEEGQPADAAILAATDAHAALLAALPDELLAARADDVRSVGRRAARLVHGTPTSMSGAAGGVAVAEDLGPADIADVQALGAGHRAGRRRPDGPRRDRRPITRAADGHRTRARRTDGRAGHHPGARR